MSMSVSMSMFNSSNVNADIEDMRWKNNHGIALLRTNPPARLPRMRFFSPLSQPHPQLFLEKPDGAGMSSYICMSQG